MMDKQRLFARIDGHRQQALERGRAFFACPEPGFREFETENMICEQLDKWGVSYQRDVALTGVIATLGQGGYHIAVLADMDALPRQDGKGFIHSCGHSIQVANALTALHALLPCADSLNGRVSFLFTPAEELTDPEGRAALREAGKIAGRSGKQDMIAKGCFDDVDCVLSCHASGDAGSRFDVDSVLTGFMLKKAVFLGKASHSGAAPHLGRNALHGAVLAQNALSFLKEQFAPDCCLRLSPVISDIGGGVNIIPDRAALESYVRAVDRDSLLLAGRRFDRCVQGCADALGLELELHTAPGYLPLNQNALLCRAVEENMLAFCSPEQIAHHPISGASGDAGDIGTLLPSIQFGFSGIRGVFHSDSFAIEDEELCYMEAAKVLVGTIADILTRPELQVKASDFQSKKESYLKNWLNV